MTIKADEMAKAVRVAIDMNRSDESLVKEGDEETLSLEEIIKAKLAEGVRLTEQEAPLEMLESGHDFGDNIYIREDGSGYVILPHDFMRLISFRMQDWDRTVYEAISPTSPEYCLQTSRHKGVRGSKEKPVCAIVRNSLGKVLEFWSTDIKDEPDTSVADATYLPYPEIGKDGMIDVAEECYEAAVYRTAALTLASLGDPLTTTMMEISKSLLQ